MVSKLVVLGKEIQLPGDFEESEIKDNLESVLRDLEPELLQEIKDTEYTTRVEGETLVVYRTGATFG